MDTAENKETTQNNILEQPQQNKETKEEVRARFKRENRAILKTLIVICLLIAIPIIIYYWTINSSKNASQFDYKVTYTSIEYNTSSTYFLFQIERNSEYESTIYNTDFVLYINGTPTSSEGFLVGNIIYKDIELSSSGKGIIKVVFDAVKLQIDQPIQIFFKTKQITLNEYTTIK